MEKPARLIFGMMLSVLLLASLAGCMNEEVISNDTIEEAKMLCIRLCQAKEDDLRFGPCITNNLINDWVCDVAHRPKQEDVDGLPENQCSAYREGLAHHFVEVTPDCEFIRAV